MRKKRRRDGDLEIEAGIGDREPAAYLLPMVSLPLVKTRGIILPHNRQRTIAAVRHLIFADLAVSNLRSKASFRFDNKDRGRIALPIVGAVPRSETTHADRRSQSHEQKKKKKNKKQLFSTSQNAIGGNYAPLLCP